MLVVEHSMQGHRLVWTLHALHVQHDDVLDETKYFVPPLVSLHDRHEVLNLVEDRLAEAIDDPLGIVSEMFRTNFLRKLSEEAVGEGLLWRFEIFIKAGRGGSLIALVKRMALVIVVVSLLQQELLGELGLLTLTVTVPNRCLFPHFASIGLCFG